MLVAFLDVLFLACFYLTIQNVMKISLCTKSQLNLLEKRRGKSVSGLYVLFFNCHLDFVSHCYFMF